jgi:histidyl-tRNA synthetase
VIIAFNQDHMGEYFRVAGELRAMGVAAEVYLGQSGMKAQMKYADRRKSPFAIMLGDDEIAAGEVSIKDLDEGLAASKAMASNALWKETRPGQYAVKRSELVAAVLQRLKDRDGEA